MSNAKNFDILMCVLGVDGGCGWGWWGVGRLLLGGIVVVAGLVTEFVRVAAIIALAALLVWCWRWWWW